MRRLGRPGGFTLIEMMIVLVVVSILAAIALPSYPNAARRMHRAAAQAFLAEVALKQGQRLSDARSYADSLSALGVDVPNTVVCYYTVSVTADDTPSFIVTATAVGDQAADGNLSWSSSGQRLPAGKW